MINTNDKIIIKNLLKMEINKLKRMVVKNPNDIYIESYLEEQKELTEIFNKL